MIGVSSALTVGEIKAIAVSNRTMTPEEWADLAANKMMHVADSAPPPIKDQALAFKARLKSLAAHYIRMAVDERKSRDAHLAETAGHPDIAAQIRSE